jgi:hypothetical protein
MADEMIEYVVVADMVTISQGKANGTGEEQVLRVERNTTINAPEGNASITELLAMGGVVRKDALLDTMKALKDKASKHRPTVVRMDDQSFRVTAAGTALTLAGDEELPSPVVEDTVPLSAPDLDVSAVV